jgi:hypothetical protein
MNKTILAILIGALIISGTFYLTMPEDERGIFNEKEEVVDEEELNEGKDEEMGALVDCLAEKGVVIYGSRTCPACANLAEGFGGYNVIESIYVECMDEGERCSAEKTTGYVPEIQVEGELYAGSFYPENLAVAVGCRL